ncbi:hypothetical protein VNO77_44009 [Canavalia gladiata]|uniref:Uncharacterized protein n=1 Tax=Canavalia gladiata TaxID=3824 RepID=A0AAN9JXF6_CANGL
MSISSRLIRIGWCSAEVYQATATRKGQGGTRLTPSLFHHYSPTCASTEFLQEAHACMTFGSFGEGAHAIGTSWRFLILQAQIHSSSLGLEYQGSFYVLPISDGDASQSNLYGSLSISLVV